METDEIISSLYTEYYLKDSTPEQLVSSYWKYYQGQVEIEIEDGNIRPLKGTMLGDLINKSGVSQMFAWLTVGGYLIQLRNRKEITRLIKPSLSLTKRMGLAFNYACFRQICSLALIRDTMRVEGKLKAIIIGDGYGFLGSLIKEIDPDSSIVLVDLGRILLWQAYYCARAHPGRSHYLVANSQELNEDKLEHDFIYCPAEHLKMVDSLSFDLAINIASMQEMNQETIEEYFSYLRKHSKPHNLFYCCNREEKIMPGGESSRFFNYPWSDKDVHLVDEYCPWQRYFLALWKSEKGLAVLNVRIPFVNYFDGEIRHRLTVLDVNE